MKLKQAYVRRSGRWRTAAATGVVAFSLMLPLVGCSCDTSSVGKEGVVMAEMKQKSTLDEYRNTKDKEKFAGALLASKPFVEYRQFLAEVLNDDSLEYKDKKNALAPALKGHRGETLDFCLELMKGRPFSVPASEKVSSGEEKTALVLARAVSVDEAAIRKFAKHVASISPSMMDGFKENPVVPRAVGYLVHMLVYRSQSAGEDSGLKLAREIMKSHNEYSIFVSAMAASAMMEINPVKSAPLVNRERKSTLNPYKEALLGEVINDYKGFVPKKN